MTDPHDNSARRDPHAAICPNWVRSEMAKLLNDLDGSHDEAMVGAVALLGPDGFDFKTREQSTNFDPAQYGPVMLEGYAMLAGASLARTLDAVHAATEHPDHFTQDIEDDAERLQALRNLYEQAMRQWLKSAIAYAGPEFQRRHKHDLSLAAGSQLLNLWQRITESTIKFQQPPQQEDDEDADTPAP